MSKQPEYKLKMLRKSTGEKGEIGAGWKNTDGSISIVLNLGVTIKQSKDQVITLFLRDFD